MARGATRRDQRRIRALHVRTRMIGTGECPRMAVRVSNTGICVQFLDDMNHVSLGGMSVRGSKKVEDAGKLGVRAAEFLKEKKIQKVVFDRGGRRFHGRLKAVADAVRQAGIRV